MNWVILFRTLLDVSAPVSTLLTFQETFNLNPSVLPAKIDLFCVSMWIVQVQSLQGLPSDHFSRTQPDNCFRAPCIRSERFGRNFSLNSTTTSSAYATVIIRSWSKLTSISLITVPPPPNIRYFNDSWNIIDRNSFIFRIWSCSLQHCWYNVIRTKKSEGLNVVDWPESLGVACYPSYNSLIFLLSPYNRRREGSSRVSYHFALYCLWTWALLTAFYKIW